MKNDNLLQIRVSEICTKRICVNQGVDVNMYLQFERQNLILDNTYLFMEGETILNSIKPKLASLFGQLELGYIQYSA